MKWAFNELEQTHKCKPFVIVGNRKIKKFIIEMQQNNIFQKLKIHNNSPFLNRMKLCKWGCGSKFKKISYYGYSNLRKHERLDCKLK